MNKLNVDKCCHKCPDFEPEVIEPQPIYDTMSNYEGKLGPILVFCEQRNTCRRFMEYLQKRLIKEKGENI